MRIPGHNHGGLPHNSPQLPRDMTFFIGTEAEIDIQRESSTINAHPHAHIRHALGAAKRTKHRSPSFDSVSNSPSVRTPAIELPSGKQSIQDDHDDSLDSEPENYGIETLASFPRDESFSHVPTSSILSSSSSVMESFAASLSDYPLSNYGGDHTSLYGPISLQSVRSGRSIPRSEMQPIEIRESSQFIMPKVSMPTRRPFTETGRGLGRLKLLFVGSKGCGKTSLIESISTACEHIVHTDMSQSKGALIETLASSKPQPRWWSHSSEHSTFRINDKLEKEELLDRNITFLEAPGFEVEGATEESTLSAIADYMVQMMTSVSPVTSQDSPVARMLGSEESPLISAIIYVISPTGLSETDIRVLRVLQDITNIIPVISQADLQIPSILRLDKAATSNFLNDGGIQPFIFNSAGQPAKNPIYTVSTVPSNDPADVDLDASLLMASDYKPKITHSDLQGLIEDIFAPHGASWLRYSAAKKAIAWWGDKQSRYRPNCLQLCSRHRAYLSNVGNPFLPMYNRLCYDHERWARDLQRSLSNARYPLSREILEAIDEEMKIARHVESGGMLIKRNTGEIIQHRESEESSHRRQRNRRETPQIQQDPLGLLTTIREFKTSGWSAVQVMSAVGLVGGGIGLGSLR